MEPKISETIRKLMDEGYQYKYIKSQVNIGAGSFCRIRSLIISAYEDLRISDEEIQYARKLVEQIDNGQTTIYKAHQLYKRRYPEDKGIRRTYLSSNQSRNKIQPVYEATKLESDPEKVQKFISTMDGLLHGLERMIISPEQLDEIKILRRRLTKFINKSRNNNNTIESDDKAFSTLNLDDEDEE